MAGLEDVKITDASQIETLISTTKAFTEQAVVTNKLLDSINSNTVSIVKFFEGKDGFSKMLQDFQVKIADDNKMHMKIQFRILYLKVAGSLGALVVLFELVIHYLFGTPTL